MKHGKDNGMHMAKFEKMCDFNMSLFPLNFFFEFYHFCKTRLPLLKSSSFVVFFSPLMEIPSNFSVHNPSIQH
jgi:hypothetical protein